MYKKANSKFDCKQVLSMIERYNFALELLDAYDHQNMERPKGNEVYNLLEEAANLLYFVIKNYSFVDGNKRIAATMFLYFLDKNDALFCDGKKRIEDSTLVALTIMITESKPEEKEMMIGVVMNCIV